MEELSKLVKAAKKLHIRHREKKQLILNAAIILNREVAGSNRGLNLMDGLKLQYGHNQVHSRTIGGRNWRQYVKDTTIDGSFRGSFPAVPFSSIVTNTISIPAVTYDLNIFNDKNEQDEVLASPSLLAEDGKAATYFAGRDLILGIQGPETSEIQKFPFGVTLEMTPYFLKDHSIDIKVKVGRQLLIPSTGVTTFTQVAEALNENTATTVNLDWGETVVISALSEHTQLENNDRTLFLSKVPILKYLFSNQGKSDVKTSILFLITPQRYISLENESASSHEHEFAEYYDYVAKHYANPQRLLDHLRQLQIPHKTIILSKIFYSSKELSVAAQHEEEALEDQYGG